LLHNFIKRKDGFNYEDNNAEKNSMDDIVSIGIWARTQGPLVRDYFANYRSCTISICKYIIFSTILFYLIQLILMKNTFKIFLFNTQVFIISFCKYVISILICNVIKTKIIHFFYLFIFFLVQIDPIVTPISFQQLFLASVSLYSFNPVSHMALLFWINSMNLSVSCNFEAMLKWFSWYIKNFYTFL